MADELVYGRKYSLDRYGQIIPCVYLGLEKERNKFLFRDHDRTPMVYRTEHFKMEKGLIVMTQIWQKTRSVPAKEWDLAEKMLSGAGL